MSAKRFVVIDLHSLGKRVAHKRDPIGLPVPDGPGRARYPWALVRNVTRNSELSI